MLIISTGCVEKPSDTKEYLEFDSGGEYHPSGYGAWNIRLCGDGSIIVSHAVGGETKSRDVFFLTTEESRNLISLFCAVDIKKMKSSTRPGEPDEVLYSLGLRDGSGTYNKSVWIDDAREDPAIMGLVDYLEVLVEKYSGQRPVMR